MYLYLAFRKYQRQMSEFAELYRKLSTSELLKIISESEKYKPIAVETAKIEIKNRNLSEEDILKSKAILKKDQKEKQAKLNKRKEKEKKLKESAFSFLESISPIQNGIRTPEKIMRYITIIFGGIAIYRIFNQFSFFHFMFTDGISKWDWSIAEYIVPLLALPIAVVLFWKRKKAGWFLMAIFLTYSAVSALGMLIINLDRKPSGIVALDSIFPTVSPMSFLLAMLFYMVVLWLIYKNKIRDIFKVSEQTAFMTIGFTAILNLIYLYIIMNTLV